MRQRDVWKKIIPLSKFHEGQKVEYIRSPKHGDVWGIVKNVRRYNAKVSVVRESEKNRGLPIYEIEWHKDKQRPPWILYYTEDLLREY